MYSPTIIDTINALLTKINIVAIKINPTTLQVPNVIMDEKRAELLFDYDGESSLLSVDCYGNIEIDSNHFLEALKYINMVNAGNNKGHLFIDKDHKVGFRHTVSLFEDDDIDTEYLDILMENTFLGFWAFAKYVLAIQQGKTADEVFAVMNSSLSES